MHQEHICVHFPWLEVREKLLGYGVFICSGSAESTKQSFRTLHLLSFPLVQARALVGSRHHQHLVPSGAGGFGCFASSPLLWCACFFKVSRSPRVGNSSMISLSLRRTLLILRATHLKIYDYENFLFQCLNLLCIDLEGGFFPDSLVQRDKLTWQIHSTLLLYVFKNK